MLSNTEALNEMIAVIEAERIRVARECERIVLGYSGCWAIAEQIRRAFPEAFEEPKP